MKEIEFKIEATHIQDLLRGKKLVYERHGEYRVILYPENYGFFISPEQLHKIRQSLSPEYGEAIFDLIDTILKEASKPITPTQR